ncbi:MAG: hypothetical protein JST73_05865, partial [Actinobacteria bacterium]|nr:hypothetical protein [Actinomycetota bacterium]
ILQAANGLESTLGLLCGSGLVAVWMWSSDRPSTRRSIAVGVVAGLAVLARIDLIGLVVLLGCVQLWRGPRRELFKSAAAAVVVLAPWWGYSIMRFGTPIPQSGIAERFLGAEQVAMPHGQLIAANSLHSLAGPFVSWNRGIDLLVPHALVWSVALVGVLYLGAAAFGVVATIHRKPDTPYRDSPAYAAAAALFGLVVIGFYTWFSVSWYTYRYTAPGGVITTVIIACGIGRLVAERRIRPVGPVIAALTVLALVVAFGRPMARMLQREATTSSANFTSVRFDKFVPSTNLRSSAIAANKMTPPGAKIGTWNSGAMSYFATDGRHVVNLDGVVNHAAAIAYRKGETGRYIADQRIEWIIDFPYAVVGAAMTTPGTRAGPMVLFSGPHGVSLGVAHLRYPADATSRADGHTSGDP